MIDFAKELGAIDWKDSLNAYTICDDVIGRAISGGHAKKLLASIPQKSHH